MSTFADLLNRKAEDVKAPPQVPIGTYQAMVKEPAKFDEGDFFKSGVIQDRITFLMSITEAVEVMDDDALAEFGNVKGATLRREFTFAQADDADSEAGNARTSNYLKQFLNNLDCLDDDATLGEGVANATGCSCLIEVDHRQDKNDPAKFYAYIKRTYAAE